jgi:serine/threonine-protein kinase
VGKVPDADTDTADTAAPRPPAVGDRIAGRYVLQQVLARGGMASVWLATDNVLERDVAVKILHPHLAEDAAFVARFREEAIAVARLRHTNIVSIYDTCSDEGVEAIVMELVRGRTLRAYLDEHGPLHPAEAVHICAEVASALGASHRAGLVHRDVKPGNILIRNDGQVLVTDFGIAKLDDRRGDHTQAGMLVGSVRYLSPEQVEGRPVDARTDVYALGLVLYECLTGRLPFTGETDTAVALARLREAPVRPRQIRPGIPRALEAVTLRALAQNPADRYPTAADFRAALLAAPESEEAFDADSTLVVPAPVPRPSPAPTAAAQRAPAPTFAQSERGWLLPTFLILLVALAFGLGGVLLGRTPAGQNLFGKDTGHKTGTPTTLAGGAPIRPVAAVDFDPNGSAGEHPELVPLAIDGNTSTAWTTEKYSSRDVGKLKGGVGLIIDLGAPHTVDTVTVRSPTTGWSGSVYVADAKNNDVAAWGSPVSTTNADGDATFQMDGAQGRYVLVWFTDLGNGTPSQMSVSEVEVTGT